MGYSVWNGSGGSTRGIGIFYATLQSIEKHGAQFDLYSGVSISALMTVPLAMGKIEELKELFDNFTIDFIFENTPVNSNGGLTFKAVFRAVRGCESLGKMTPIRDVLKDLISKEDFELYKSDDKYASCIVMAVDFRSGRRIFKDMKMCSYSEFIDHCMASASIPVFTEAVRSGDYILYDGGVRDHSIGHWVMENYQVDEMITYWSRPEDNKIVIENWEPKDVLHVIERLEDIRTVEISKKDEFKEIVHSTENDIRHRSSYLPQVLQSQYDTDRKRLNLLKEEGIKSADLLFNN